MQSDDLRLLSLHNLIKGGRWRSEAMRSYSEDQLIWFTRGQGRLTVAGITRGYGPHNAVFVPAGTMHAFELGNTAAGTVVLFGRDHGLGLPDGPRHLRIRDVQGQTEMTALLDSLQRESDGDRPARARAMQSYAGLLSVWLERQLLDHEDALAPATAARKLARRYSELVEQRFHTHDSVSDYASALGVTPTHLTRICKQSMGRTASDFLADRKISEARRLLADTKLPVKEIAAGLGFSSPAYFTRAFHGRIGTAPLAFRRAR